MMKPLHSLELPWKLLITCFLLVLSSGFVVSELYLMHTTEMADGKEGMSLDDITFTFYGNREKTRLSAQAEGPMKKYFSETQDADKLTAEEQADLKTLVDWTARGAPEAEFWNEEHKSGPILKILNARGCIDCHAADSTMKGNKKDSPLDTFAAVGKFTVKGMDKGIDKGRLLMLSHVHLLGMGMMFLLVGAAVAASSWSKRIRCALILGGLGSIPVDIFGWWSVKYGGPAFSIVVMFGGILMAASFGASVFVALYDLWIRKSSPSGSGPVLVGREVSEPASKS